MEISARHYIYQTIANNLQHEQFLSLKDRLDTMDDTELSEISAIPLKSPMIAIILATTLGAMAIPTFYLKKYTIATVQVMLYVVMIACLIVMCLEDLWETTSPLLYNESIEIIFIILTLFFEVCVFGLWAYCIFNVRKWTFDYNYSLLSKTVA